MPSTKDENLTNLGDFFSLISDEKKKKEEEYKSLLGDLSSVLSELDKASKTPKKQERKKDKPVQKESKKESKKIEESKVDINSLFEELAVLKKKEEEKRKKQTKEIKAFENWLFKEPIEVVDEVINEDVEIEEYSKPLIETPLVEYETPIEVTFEEEQEEPVIEEVEEEDPEIEEPIDDPIEEEEIVEEKPEENPTVSQVLDTLKSLIKDENIVEEKNSEIESLKKEVRDLRNLLYQGLRDVAAQGGGGEVRLEFLDDIDRNSAKVNDKFLKYNSSTGKWEGADASGGGVSNLVDLNDVDITDLANRRVLIYDSTSSTFKFVDPSEIMDLADNISDDIIDYGSF
jgi:hypothetical protein